MTPISLARNLRNSRTIHELATRVGGRAPGTCEGTEGRPVEFITAEDPQAVKHELSRLLHRLIRDEGVAPEDVAILTARTKSRSSLAGEERVGAFRIAPDVAPGDNAVLYETISRFKGLERPVVILIDVGAMLERQPTLGYVGITRATSHLVIIDSAAALARLGG
jgi:superfamily I DNA/RNA helicase